MRKCQGLLMRAQPPTGARPPPPVTFKHLMCQSVSRPHCGIDLRQFAVNPTEGACKSNKQKRRCTYCSHALILCEAFRAKFEQSIILTETEQNHLLARAATKRALTEGAENVDEYVSCIGDDLYVPAEGPFRNS
jgi:hypothetical protein